MTRSNTTAVLACATLLAAGAAWADTTYTIDKVTITGSKTVPTETLMGAIQEHKGSRVTQADIVSDRDAIMKVLGDARVGGSVKASMSARGSHMVVTFIVDDQGVQTPTVTKVPPKLHEETFVGNKSVPTATLVAAAALAPGDELTNAKMAAAQKAIADAYKAAKLQVAMQVSFTVNRLPGVLVDVVWTIVETKNKPKTRDERSQEAQDQIQ